MNAKANRKAVVLEQECVACGCCKKACPRSAIEIFHGLYAVVSQEMCVGCGLCQKACPASIIQLEVRE